MGVCKEEKIREEFKVLVLYVRSFSSFNLVLISATGTLEDESNVNALPVVYKKMTRKCVTKLNHSAGPKIGQGQITRYKPV